MTTTTLLVLAAAGLAIKNYKIIIGAGLKSVDNYNKKVEKARKYESTLYNLRDDVKEKREKLAEACQSSYVTEDFRFWTLDRKQSKKYKLSRVDKFDIEKDIIIHGRLLTKNKAGKVSGEDIFLFQPRMYGRNEVLIGPRLNKDGHLPDKTMYAINDEELGYVMGYAAKREVVTGMRMDFDVQSTHSIEERFKGYKKKSKDEQQIIDGSQSYMQIIVDRDESGNIIPFDMTKEENKKLFDSYIEKHRKIFSHVYYQDKIKEVNDIVKEKIEEQRRRFEQIAIEEEVEAKRAQEEREAQSKQTKAPLTEQEEYNKKMRDYYMYGIKPSYASNLPDMPPRISRPYEPVEDRIIDPTHMLQGHGQR